MALDWPPKRGEKTAQVSASAEVASNREVYQLTWVDSHIFRAVSTQVMSPTNASGSDGIQVMVPEDEESQSACAGIPEGEENEETEVSEEVEDLAAPARDNEGKVLPLEDTPSLPNGPPQVLGPRIAEPLFTQEQLRQAEELDKMSSLLQLKKDLFQTSGAKDEVAQTPPQGLLALTPAQMPFTPAVATMPLVPVTPPMQVPMGDGSIGTHGSLVRQRPTPTPQMVQSPAQPVVPPFNAGYPSQFWQEEQMRFQLQVNSEFRQMNNMMKQLQEENLFLRMQLMEEREPKYATPPEQPLVEHSVGPAPGLDLKGKKVKALKDGKTGKKDKEAAEKKAAPSLPTSSVVPTKAAPSTPQEAAEAKKVKKRVVTSSTKEDGSVDRQALKELSTVVEAVGNKNRSKDSAKSILKEDGPAGQQAKEDGSVDRQDPKKKTSEKKALKKGVLKEDGPEGRVTSAHRHTSGGL